MSGGGSLRRSCRRGRGSRRGWRRCCRCCICTVCPASDFGPALEQFLGSDQGLSAATITRLTDAVARRGAGVQHPVAGRYRTTSTAGSTASCATRRCMTGWGCETSTAGLSWQPGEAGSSLSRGTPVRVGSGSDNAGTRRHCQTARVRLARREGVREKPVCKAPQSTHQLQSGGYGLGCGAHRPAECWPGTLGRS